MQKESFNELQNALEKVVYPANKTKIIEMSKSLNAPSEAIKALEKIPDKEYQSSSDVLQEFKGIKGFAHLLGM